MAICQLDWLKLCWVTVAADAEDAARAATAASANLFMSFPYSLLGTNALRAPTRHELAAIERIVTKLRVPAAMTLQDR
jgi:hypothetical protein